MNETLRHILRKRVPPLSAFDVDAIIKEFEATQKTAVKKKFKRGKR